MKNFIRGIIYGVFSICPGLSGGILAIKYGDYKKIITIINSKKFNSSIFLYLLDLFSGFMIGSILFSNIINYLYSSYLFTFNVFIILVSIYLCISLIIDSNIKILNLVLLVIFSFVLFLLIKNFDISIPNKPSLFIISGLIFSLSKIIPGLSATGIFINVGFYKYLISFFSNPLIFFSNTKLWIMFWGSFIICSYFTIKFISGREKALNYIVIIIMIINICIMLN